MERLRALAPAVALMLALSLPVAVAAAGNDEAADGHAAGTADGELAAVADGEHGDDHGGAGLPQFDTSTYPAQLFWLIVSFGALYWLVTTKVAPKIEATLEERSGKRQGDLDLAANLRAEADELYANYERELAKASESARAEMADARSKLDAEIAAKSKALDEELAGELSRAMADMRSQADAALAGIDDVAIEVAQSAVGRLTGDNVDAAEVRRALDRARAEVA